MGKLKGQGALSDVNVGDLERLWEILRKILSDLKK